MRSVPVISINRDYGLLCEDRAIEGLLTPDTINMAILIAIIGFLWRLSRDIADLRERMARLEELFEGFAGRTGREAEDA